VREIKVSDSDFEFYFPDISFQFQDFLFKPTVFISPDNDFIKAVYPVIGFI
jgi:hypothetical protein